jgi:cytochrome c oxidase cbb3-type subunit 2
VGALLITFLVLIWLDSAAFAIVQASPSLKAATWGSEGKQLLQGGVHFVAAVVAGALLDAGFGIAVPLIAWGLFAVAFPLLQHGGMGAGPIYAMGISFYSTALVVAPTWGGTGASPSPRWRAGLLYGVAGWVGSALGVGMAQDLGRIPGWFLVATGAALAVAWVRPVRIVRRLIPLWGPALALGAAGIVAVWIASERTEAAPLAQGSDAAVARGRLVYVQEGCIHCHSQYVRPGTRDVSWWGPFRPLDRSERPPLVGTRRQGPDLLQVGNRRSEVWHEVHLKDPRRLNPGSLMPSYAYLFAGDGQRGQDLVAYLASLGKGTAVERWAMTKAEPLAPPPAAPSAARGAHLFATYCAVCHGADGQGDGPLAAQVSDPYANLRKPGGFRTRLPLASVIRHGLPSTSMPGHEWLTGQQVEDLVAYVRVADCVHPCPSSVSVPSEEAP